MPLPAVILIALAANAIIFFALGLWFAQIGRRTRPTGEPVSFEGRRVGG